VSRFNGSLSQTRNRLQAKANQRTKSNQNEIDTNTFEKKINERKVKIIRDGRPKSLLSTARKLSKVSNQHMHETMSKLREEIILKSIPTQVKIQQKLAA